MGLFSSSSRRTTVNEDNRTINDYSGSNWEFDNSVRHETDSSVTGDNNNNSGTIITTHDGAFDVVAESNLNSALLAAEGFSLAEEGFALADSVTSDMSLLADSAMSINAGVATDALEYGVETFNSAAGVLSDVAFLSDQQNARGLDAALAVHDAGLEQLNMGTELAYGLAEMNAQNALAQQVDNNNALNNGFKSMMQFAENFSRSDGAQVAETNMKTVGVIAFALVAGAYFMRGNK